MATEPSPHMTQLTRDLAEKALAHVDELISAYDWVGTGDSKSALGEKKDGDAAWATVKSLALAGLDAQKRIEELEAPTPTPDTVEAVARAICGAKFGDDDFDKFEDYQQDNFREQARAAIAAYEARRK